MTAEEEARLIRRVQARDERAFRALFRQHNPYLHRLALRLTAGHADEAEDVVAETWRRAMLGLSRFRFESRLRTWLSTIAVRSLGRRGPEVDLDEARQPDAEPRPDAAVRLDLERVFARLPVGYRTVLVLHDVEGYTHDEIARMLDVAPGTSKSQLSRARAWMRAALGEDYRDYREA